METRWWQGAVGRAHLNRVLEHELPCHLSPARNLRGRKSAAVSFTGDLADVVNEKTRSVNNADFAVLAAQSCRAQLFGVR